MPHRLTGRDFRNNPLIAKYWDSLTDDEYEQMKEEWYRKSPQRKKDTFEDLALQADQDAKRAFRAFRYVYGADPDMITIHDIMCAWLYTDDTDEAYEELGPEKLVIGQRRGPRRYRVARRVQGIKEHPEFGRPGRGGNSSRHQPHASHGMGTSGADAFADDFGGLGMGDGSRAGYGRSNHRGRDNTGRGPSRPRHDGHGGADMGLSHGGHHGARPDYGSRREPPSRRTYQPQQSGMYESQAHKPSGYGGTSRSHGHMSRYQGGYDDDGDY